MPAQRRLEAYWWPGNVAELKSVVGRLVASRHCSTVRTHDLPREIAG